MKTLFQLTVSLLISSFFVSQVFAKEIPVSQNWELELPAGEFVVLDFPFDIELRTTPYKRVETRIEKEGIKEEGSLGLKLSSSKTTENDSEEKNTSTPEQKANQLAMPSPTQKPVAKNPTPATEEAKQKKIKNSAPISIKKGVNTVELFAKKAGEFEMVVWGYDDYPLMLKLKFIEPEPDVLMEKFYKFTLQEQNDEEAIAFESNAHEDVISRVTYALYNKLTPKGYRKIANTQVFEYPDLKMELRLVYTLVGNQYLGEYWEVTNNSTAPLKLHEESFYEEGVYAVSFLQNELTPGGTTPMYITRNARLE